MNGTQMTLLAITSLAGAIAGGVLVATLADAHADEPATTAPEGLRLLCRTFLVDLDGATLETSDRTTEVGQWIGQESEGGWRLHGLDFEVGQKRTGYPQGYVQVCLQR